MNKIGFLFICSLYAVFSLFSFEGELSLSTQLYLSLAAIFAVGIPHGALDHIIFLKNNSCSQTKFYSIYIGTMMVYVGLWFLLPKFSLVTFLLISAYHFGQSQFSTYDRITKSFKILLYLFWGISILSGLVYYRNDEITAFLIADNHIEHIAAVFNAELYLYLNIISLAITLILLMVSVFSSNITIEALARELLLLVLIHTSFYVLPVILGFSLYFVILHSGKVLLDEYEFFRLKIDRLDLWKFIKMLLPITAISIFFLLGLIYTSSIGWLPISNTFLALILVSIFTLPHSIVMEIFYEKLR